MARRVKLQDTGEYGMSDNAYRAPTGKYYSTQAAYEKCNGNKEYRQKCIDLMFNILGYKNNMIIPTYFYKALKNYEGVGYEALYNTMISQDNAVQWALQNKVFSGEVAKVMYIMAIYDNHVMDEYKLLCSKNTNNLDYENKFEDVEPISDNTNRRKESKNISRFLEED